MALKAKQSKKPRKVRLEQATASEIISSLGIRQAEQRRARAAVAAAEKMVHHRSGPDKKRVSERVARLRQAKSEKD